MNRQRWLLVGFLFVLTAQSQSALAQSRLIDSLKTTLFRKLTDTTRVLVYYDIANAFYKQNQSDSAEVYLKSVRQISQRINYAAGLGDYNRLRGVMRMHRGLYEEALTHYQEAVKYYTKAGKLTYVSQVYSNMGWLYKMMGDSQHVAGLTKQGMVYVQQAIAINQRLRASNLLVGNYINLGIIYEDLGEYKLGRDCFFKAIAIADQSTKDPNDYRVLYNNLGKNYHVTGEYRRAIGYLQKALAINLPLKKLSSLAHNYRNLASAYRGLNQPDSAVFYGEKSLAVVKAAKESPLTNSVYGELALSYAAARQYEKAYAAVVEHKRVEDSLMTFDKTRTIVRLQGQYAVQQAKEIADIRANLELARAGEIARIRARNEQEIATVQAEERQRLAQIKATSDVEKAELATKYNTQKRVQQIASLGQLNGQRAQQLRYMTVGVGLLILLVSLLITQYYLLRRANARLSTQNEIITVNSRELENQSNQLRTLMRELHHRVKNNLAIVSGLLNLQMNGLHDEKAIQAVRVGQQRVEAMSLIHQRLYQTDQLTVVNMQAYLNDLVHSLMDAYGYQADGIRLQLDVEQRELDVDVAIPIGLIINELVSNAFKHAYARQPNPALRIGLHQDKDPLLTGITLEVQDNGTGVEAADWRRASSRSSFGKRLIATLSEQLEGTFELLNENGTLFRLHIPKAWAAPTPA